MNIRLFLIYSFFMYLYMNFTSNSINNTLKQNI